MQEVVAVDIGNSAIKLASRSSKSAWRIEAQATDEQLAESLSEFTTDLKSDSRWLVCCVDQAQARRIQQWVAAKRPSDSFRLIEADEIPLASEVTEREALGRDRLLAAWFAAAQTEQTEPANSAIIIDGGTAITIDVVAAEKHLGGLIFPGPRTVLASLAEQTAALPDLAEADPPKLGGEIQLGTSTEPAILLGVHQSQLLGSIAIVESLEQQYAKAQVWCCGGLLAGCQSQLPKHWNFRSDFLTQAIFHLDETNSK